MAPFDLASSLGPVAYALVFGAIGFAFGAVLEMGGFGDTRKLAGQFYFRDMTVLKVMFTAIAVGAILVAFATSIGILDMSRVFVNPTYLWPGIVGGLIMGVGFVIGGFCPGTSLVAASTLKVDGILFLAGALVGVFLFGETVAGFQTFWLSSYMGRFTLPELLGLPVGVTVLLVVAMALALFWLGDLAQQAFGEGKPWAEVRKTPGHRGVAFGAALVAASLVLVAHGQPSPEAKFARMSPEVRRAVEDRSIFVDPAEVVALRKDVGVQVVLLDLREERDFNLFHLGGSRRASLAELESAPRLKLLLDQPPTTVTFLVGTGEASATTAWRRLTALGVPNLYVVEGGVNRWLERYPVDACVAGRLGGPWTSGGPPSADEPAWRFAYATGSSLPAAWPEVESSRTFRSPCATPAAAGHEAGHDGAAHGVARWPEHAYTKRVKLKSKAAVKGGCG
ncbi:MAG TPA: YeeE/YedE thiosulfate transporter family protein [Anaeromyxobacteraceae bacterium]|nr:YeeE/YedE thiosulfate transporter family protein [Anaeromyxobacteraceae bacterium]